MPGFMKLKNSSVPKSGATPCRCIHEKRGAPTLLKNADQAIGESGNSSGKAQTSPSMSWRVAKGDGVSGPSDSVHLAPTAAFSGNVEQTFERLNVLGGLARLVNNQVSAAMDPFQDRRSRRRLEVREVVARNGDEIESAVINPRIGQAVGRNHFRKRGRVRRGQRAEAHRVARAAGRPDVTRTIDRPGRDHEHCRRRLDVRATPRPQ